MSSQTTRQAIKRLDRKAPLFAALADETRLTLLVRLGQGQLLSITHLAEDSTLTRQAIRKHLSILEGAGMVRSVRRGRENLFQLEPKPIEEAKETLEAISQQWEQALARLKAFVENPKSS